MGENPLKSFILFSICLFVFGCGSAEPKYDNHRCENPPPPPIGQPPPPGQACQVSFVDIQPILTRTCVSCHAGYDQYGPASQRIDSFINRINLPESDPKHMPKGQDLPFNEKQLFQKFKDGGLKERCDTGGNGGAAISPSLDYIEVNILNDLNNNPNTRSDFRYLIVQGSESPSVGTGSVNKTINSLSLENRLTSASPIDRSGQILRINLRDYGWSARDWNLVEQNDSLNFESLTPNGQLIRAITGTRQPWMHQNNFAFIVHSSDIYYDILDVPDNLDDFLVQDFINIDLEDQFNNLEVDYIGFNGSPISLNKNRLIARNISQVGYMWTTYDVFNVQAQGSNLFSNPFLRESFSGNVFDFDASEIIHTLPNGLQGYSLWDADGSRQNFAPTNLVADTEGIDPQIDNALDCQRCHSGGIINAEDQIRQNVIGNTAFNLRDQQIAELLFTENEQAIINADNQDLRRVLNQISVEANSDPISASTDLLRTDYGIEKLAALVFLSTEDLSQCIQASQVLQSSIGQLVRNGSVTFEQIQVSFDDIKRDCRLGRE
jgi:hypothetical protein